MKNKTISYWAISWLGAAMAVSAPAMANKSAPDEPQAELQQVTIRDVEDAISQALVEQGAGDEIRATLISKNNPVLFETTKPMHVEISALEFDVSSMRWSAQMDIFEDESLSKTHPLSGRFEALIEVPVMNKRIYSGQVIEEADIGWKSLPENRLRKGTILSPEQLIGQSPRRVLSEARPIQEHEVERPAIAEKGDTLQVTFETAYMEIRTLGVALEKGSMGDRIRVKNADSNLVIQAVLTGPGTAEVAQIMQLSQNTH